jgi:hypothetical protein
MIFAFSYFSNQLAMAENFDAILISFSIKNRKMSKKVMKCRAYAEKLQLKTTQSNLLFKFQFMDELSLLCRMSIERLIRYYNLSLLPRSFDHVPSNSVCQ